MPQKFVITIESKEAFEWLQGLVDNTAESPNSKPMISAPQHVLAWQKAFQNASKLNDDEERPVKKTAAKRKRTARRKKPEVDKLGLSCHLHPTYGVKQAPRTDCEICWDAYEKLHGRDMRRKKERMFKLKQKKKSS